MTDELGALRATHAAWRRVLEARYPHPSAQAWLAREEPPTWRWLIAFDARGLPLGDEVSGLVVVREQGGTLQWAARRGLFMVPVGVEPDVQQTEGTIELTAMQLAGIQTAVAAAFLNNVESVPDGGYDGMPASDARPRTQARRATSLKTP